MKLYIHIYILISMIDPRLSATIRHYIQNVKEHGIPVSSAYLFGSYAKGQEIAGVSDIDICISSPTFGKNNRKERVTLMRLREGISDLIEPHPISERDMRSRVNPFVKEIKRVGIRIR